MIIDKVNKTRYSHFMSSIFKREVLETLKQELGVTMDQIIHDTKPKKEFKNWKVKISRLINKKDKDPSNFGYLELSALLAEYFNKNPNLKEKLSLTHFIGKDEYIPCLGNLSHDGSVIEYNKHNRWKLKVDGRFKDHICLFLHGGVYNGWARIFTKLDNSIYHVNDNFGLIKEKKTKRYYAGYIQPKHNLTYDVKDFEVISYQTRTLHHNLEATQAASFVCSYKPKFKNWIKY